MRWLFDETEGLRHKCEEFERISREWVEANHPLRNLDVLDNDYLNEVKEGWDNTWKRVLTHHTVKLEDSYQRFVTSASGTDAKIYGDTRDDVVIVKSTEDSQSMKYNDLMGFDRR